MPCKHAVATIWDMEINGLKGGIPESWVHSSYWLRTWQKMYSFKIDPVNGQDFWPKSTIPITLTPPVHHTQVGRPKKKRKKSADELIQGIVKKGKLSRAGKTVACKLCKNLGHNRRSCKGQQMGSQPGASSKSSQGAESAATKRRT